MPSSTQSDSPYSFRSMVRFMNSHFALLALIGGFFISGFFIGAIWQENQLLAGGSGGSRQVAQAPSAAPAGAPAGGHGGSAPSAAVGSMPELTDSDHVLGAIDSKVVLVEYSDFECPFCARFHPTLQQVMDEYGDQVSWVYRHFPLSIHSNARDAALASECVAQLGGEDAFWEYGNELFEETRSAGGISDEYLAEAAGRVGVDGSAFQSCLDTAEHQQLVDTHFNGGSQAGVSGTPGTIVVVDGEPQELIPGALPYPQVQQVIERYL
ncbi:MAG: hypothetical protein COU69_02285 [Candidatus Pacebacteria bacterium CG10_big_fil_rev_8_21_14_0_10_56_10]|nr:MAG: hypothetical protein COU69_02285 [Candidatus Pacebacteria bacterium CG10_big_fil_rev_8_21_14_0_10_56_10]